MIRKETVTTLCIRLLAMPCQATAVAEPVLPCEQIGLSRWCGIKRCQDNGSETVEQRCGWRAKRHTEEWTSGSDVGSVARLTTPWVEMGMNDHATGSDVLFRPALRSSLLLYALCLILEQPRPCFSAVSVPIATFHLPPRPYSACPCPVPVPSVITCCRTPISRGLSYSSCTPQYLLQKHLLTSCKSAS